MHPLQRKRFQWVKLARSNRSRLRLLRQAARQAAGLSPWRPLPRSSRALPAVLRRRALQLHAATAKQAWAKRQRMQRQPCLLRCRSSVLP
jgi:hypothetical protein